MVSRVILKGKIAYGLKYDPDSSPDIASESNILPVLVFGEVSFEGIAEEDTPGLWRFVQKPDSLMLNRVLNIVRFLDVKHPAPNIILAVSRLHILPDAFDVRIIPIHPPDSAPFHPPGSQKGRSRLSGLSRRQIRVQTATQRCPENIVASGELSAKPRSLDEVQGLEVDEDEVPAGIMRLEFLRNAALIIQQAILPEQVFYLDLSHNVFSMYSKNPPLSYRYH
jgi:hypothetical protein